MGKVKEIKGEPTAADSCVTAGMARRNAASKGRPPSAGVPKREHTAAPRTARMRATRKNGDRRGRTAEHQRTVRVRELVPQTVCGPRTRVHRVFRVEERVDGSSRTHLVFNDRHGWYCEHGAGCIAVAEVRRSGKT